MKKYILILMFAIIFTLSVNANVDTDKLATNTQGYWKGDDDSSEVGIFDTVSNEYSVVSNSTCVLGDCLYLDGTQQIYVNYSFSTADSYSWCAWAYFETEVDDYGWIMDSWSGVGKTVRFGRAGTDLASAIQSSGNDPYIEMVDPIQYNQWYHVCMAVDTNVNYVWLNGVANGTGSSTATTETYTQFAWGENAGNNAEGLKGYLDELIFFNQTVNDTEVAFIYANGTPTVAQQYPYPTCVEDWQPMYTACNISDNTTLYYVDNNSCGTTVNLPVDNGTVSSCNYCTISYTSDINTCVAGLSSVESTYTFDNYAICCALTNITEDCAIPSNYTTECLGIHQSSDISGIVIDFAVEYGIQMIAFAGLVGIITLFVFGMKYLRR